MADSLFQYQALAAPVFVPAAEDVTLDKWFRPAEPPFPRRRAVPLESVSAPVFVPAAEVVTLDKWYQEQVVPVRRRPSPGTAGAWVVDPTLYVVPPYEWHVPTYFPRVVRRPLPPSLYSSTIDPIANPVDPVNVAMWAFQPPAPFPRAPANPGNTGGTFVPPSQEPNPPPTPPLGDRRKYPFLEPTSKPLHVPVEEVLRRITQKLSALTNSLFEGGYIVQTGNNKWVILPAVGRQARNPGATDDITAGYYPGTTWINTAAETVWVNVSNAAGAAVWKQVG